MILFGNAHVGDTTRTNLQVGGQFGLSDNYFLGTNWWISTIDNPLLDQFLLGAVATFRVGDKTIARIGALSLFKTGQPLFAPICPREHIAVELLTRALAPSVDEKQLYGIPIQICIQGWEIRY